MTSNQSKPVASPLPPLTTLKLVQAHGRSLRVDQDGFRTLLSVKKARFFPNRGHVYVGIGVFCLLSFVADNFGMMFSAALGGALLALLSLPILYSTLPSRTFWFEANRWGFKGSVENRMGKLLKDPVFSAEAAAMAQINTEGGFFRHRWLSIPSNGSDGERVEIRLSMDEATATEFLAVIHEYARVALRASTQSTLK
jgi:hypothetical protein